MVDVALYNETDYVPEDKRLKASIADTLRGEGADVSEVTVSFITAARMRQQNKRRRAKDQPTDVLSFPFDATFPHGSGGEILIAPEAVDHPMNSIAQHDRVAHLVVHATLHLLGYGDETDQDLAIMEHKTREILRMVRHDS